VVNRILGSYENRIANYEDFLTKVKTRRDKLAAEGADVARLDAFLSTANSKLLSVKQLFVQSKTKAGAVNYEGTMQDIRRALKPIFTALRTALTDLHTSMSDAVRTVIESTGKLKESGAEAPHTTGRPEDRGRSSGFVPGSEQPVVSATPKEKGNDSPSDRGKGRN
jgi:hypothetical protein